MHHPTPSEEAASEAKAPGCGWVLLLGCGMIGVTLVVCGGFLGLLHQQGQAAEPAVSAFSQKLAEHDYAGAYREASPALRKAQSEAEFARRAIALERVLGPIDSRRLKQIGVHALGNHKLITIRYQTTFHGGAGRLLVTVDDMEGALRVRGWQVAAEPVGVVVLGVGQDEEMLAKGLLRPLPTKSEGPAEGASPAPAPSPSPEPVPTPTPARDENHQGQ